MGGDWIAVGVIGSHSFWKGDPKEVERVITGRKEVVGQHAEREVEGGGEVRFGKWRS